MSSMSLARWPLSGIVIAARAVRSSLPAVLCCIVALVLACQPWFQQWSQPSRYAGYAAALGICILFLAVLAALAFLAAGPPAQPGGHGAGAELLNAWVYGDGIPALREAALAEARNLYGQDAELEVLRIGPITSSTVSSRGRFCTHVLVRCLSMTGQGAVP